MTEAQRMQRQQRGGVGAPGETGGPNVSPSPAETSASQLHIRMPILYSAFVLTFQKQSSC